MREKNEDQRERVEHIRHMQDVFKKERSKCRDYRTWDGHDPRYYQHSRRDDWYWDAETFYAKQRTNYRSMPREAMSYTMSHHYSILGLDRSRSEPFSDAEIKNAFRRKAMEYHPDQNQNNKAVAEAKFKEVMDSYEAIKSERQNGSC
uniref:J domain-containing protein n=1 Tax=Arundo donax TaxID=35708 RepID=A0A0A9D2Y6_ARUDO